MMAPQTALALQDVLVSTPASHTPVTVTLSVQPGEFHGVLGYGQSGKSELARVAAGQAAPRSGTVKILGQGQRGNAHDLFRRIGYQAQAPRFFPRMTVSEHIHTIARAYGVRKGRTAQILSALGLDEFSKVRIEDLSERELRLLAIAGSVVHSPQLLVLDEPTFGLDFVDRKRVISLLRSSAVGGMTALYITRNLDEIEKLCDRVTVLGSSDMKCAG